MKLFKTILAMYLVTLLSFSLWSCKQDGLGPSFVVEFQNTDVDVVFGKSGTVNYTYTGDAKGLIIRMSATPEDGYCSFKNNYSGGKGTITVTPLKNEDYECEYTLAFNCDSHKLVQKIRVKITKVVTEELVVNLAAEAVTVPVGKTATLGFTYTGNDGELTAALKETTDVFALASDATDGTGTLTFTSLKEDEYSGEHTIVFSSAEKTVEKKVSVVVNKPEAAPTAVLEKVSYTLYEGENSIDYTIRGGTPTEVVVSALEGITASVEESTDRMSGKIVLVVASNFPTENKSLTITTKNECGSNDCTVDVARAFIQLSMEKVAVPQEGMTDGNWIISTNVDECVLELEDCEEYVGAEIGVDNGRPYLKYSVAGNPSDWKRWGQIIISAKDHPEVNFKHVLMQYGSPTSLEKDRWALCILWEAMDGPNWNHTYGFDNTDSYNWCTDAPLEEWGGNFAFHQRNAGQRPYKITGSNQQGWKGELPEEFGWLDCLEEINLYTEQVTGTIPNSFCNLHKLKSITWGAGNVEGFNGRFEDMEGLKMLMKYGDLRMFYMGNNKLEGPIPYWVEYILDKWPKDNPYATMLELRENHLSGQVPDNVANHPLWTRIMEIPLWNIEHTRKIVTFMSYGEFNMYQRDNYALWVGEKPANVIQVDDHWEWLPGTNPYRIEGVDPPEN